MTSIFRKTTCSLSLSLLLILGISTAVSAEEYWLRAAETTVDLPGEAGVPMWGYALYPGDFTTASGPVTVPGPPLVVTDGTLTIHLRNELPEPTSLVILGQNSLVPTPVFFASGPYTGRVRSFTAEAPDASTPVTYVYPSIDPGTYLYQSGTHPGVQVAMGLYGAMTADVDPGVEVYPGNTYDQSLTYLFSEVDVAQHRAVGDGSYGTAAYPSTMRAGYQPDYFLLNGRSYTPDIAPEALTPGAQVLLRVLNAGLRDRVPVIPGVALEILAEDGNAYSTPRTQASVDLPASKTLDIRFTAPGLGEEQYLSLFDRSLGVSDSGRNSQGMLAHMAVGTPSVNLHVEAPSDSANWIEISSLPGGISCGLSCDQDYLPGTEISLASIATGSDSLTAWQVYDGNPAGTGVLLPVPCTSLGDCSLTLDTDRWVVPVFSSFTDLTILAPASGEVLSAGERYDIHWGAPAAATTFNVGYRIGPGSPWVMIAAGTSNKVASWQIPAGLNLRGSSQIAVTSFDASGNFIETVQSVLGLQVQDSVTLQQPNGGETLTVGAVDDDPYMINWSDLVTGTAVSRVGLWYQLSSGAPWQFIAAVDGNLHNYSWALPSVSDAATNVRVGAILYDAKGEVLVMDTSDTVFSIQPAAPPASPAGLASEPDVASIANEASDTPPAVRQASSGGTVIEPEVRYVASPALSTPPALQLLGPSAGEVLNVASGYTVFWQSLIEADTFSLAYSLDLGKNWRPLAQNLTGDQFAWQIDPALQGEAQVLLRLEAFDQTGQSLKTVTLPEPFAIE